MATKERKQTIGRRQQTSSPAPKELRSTPDILQSKEEPTSNDAQKSAAASRGGKNQKTPLVRKLAARQTKKNQKKVVAIKLNQKTKRKVHQRLAKSLINTARVLEAKKLLKNGKLRTPKKIKVEEEEIDDGPPVLEPIFPIEDNLDKKPQKKRVSNKGSIGKKIKVEPEDPAVNSDSSTSSAKNSNRKSAGATKIVVKTENNVDTVTETIEGVISGVAIPPEDIKKEPDSLSESSKSDITIKPKKLTKKQKLSLLQKEIKKENIENALTNIGPSDQKVIDMLDLNVLKVKKAYPTAQKRRHTIEQYPIGTEINTADDFSTTFNLLTSLPRSNSPKSKRKIEGKIVNPYTTRPPARLLRNGKQRKLKENLLDGLDNTRKRKRLCSDLSEVSKMSGYDSDSSFSDLSSILGAENVAEVETKKEQQNTILAPVEIKRSLSTDNQDYCTDTNSNLCPDQKKIDDRGTFLDEGMYPSPSAKVPEKLLILDIMKQTFNKELDDVAEKNKIQSSRQSSIRDSTDEIMSPVETEEKEKEEKKMSEIISKIVETMGNEEFTATINQTNEGTALVMQNGDVKNDNDVTDTAWEVEKAKVDEITSEEEGKTTSIVEDVEQLEDQSKEVQGKVNISEESPKIIEEIDDSRKEEENSVIDQSDDQNKMSIEENFQEDLSAEVEEPDEVPLTEETDEAVQQVTDEAPPELERTDGENSITVPMETEEEEQEQAATCSSEKSPELSSSSQIVDVYTPQATIPRPPDNAASPVRLFEEKEEDVAIKESIFKALGLQSLKAAEEAKKLGANKERPASSSSASGRGGETYTGTLKTVIKLNRDRDSKKKNRNQPLKMTLQKNKSKGGDGGAGNQDDYKIMKEGSTSWKSSQSSDTAGAHRKTHYSNRSNPDGSSEHTTSDGEVPNPEGGPAKALVIPEKASSFSIHPERLCKDECTYCFGKFGLFDTPCHIAQIKSVERQDKILSSEKHLTRDSCLCDACYRHIDRKANTPSYVSKSFKRGPLIAPGPKENHCHVLGCNNVSANVLRRKWIIKMKKQICQVINIDLDNPGLHSIPICDEHYVALEHLMVCAMCKRRLARNHIHYIGPEVEDLNRALGAEDIPLRLADKPVVCKLCKCFATVILKDLDERPENSTDFFVEYKKRLLHFNNIVPMDEAAAEEPIIVPTKDNNNKTTDNKETTIGANKKKQQQRKSSRNVDDPNSQPSSPPSNDEKTNGANRNDKNGDQNNGNDSSRPNSPSDYLVDYNSLIPSIAMECGDDEDPPLTNFKEKNAKKFTKAANSDFFKRIPNLESIRGAVDITVKDSMNNSDIAVQRLGSNPSLSVRQLFPGEEELGLKGRIDFRHVKEKTPEGWEKCNMTVQYDKETKQLWHELQKPYGNHSSFLRHLILLEKYFRNGDLELKASASKQSANYSECVQNRIRAFDNLPTGVSRPLTTSSSVVAAKKQQPQVPRFTRKELQQLQKVPQTLVPGLPLLTSANVSVTTVKQQHQQLQQMSRSAGTSSSSPVTITQLGGVANYQHHQQQQQYNNRGGAGAVPSPLIPLTITKTSNKPPPPPPGLISLLPGTNRPMTTVATSLSSNNNNNNNNGGVSNNNKLQPQSQKIKFPITKNWRPTLIPIDPAASSPSSPKQTEKKTGLVQVISGGKPYHITLEDYKKMCAIKRSFEMKQKRQQELQKRILSQQQLQSGNVAAALKTNVRGMVITKTSVVASSSSSAGAATVVSKLHLEPGAQPEEEEEESTATTVTGGAAVCESILEKLDQQVENLESKLLMSSNSDGKGDGCSRFPSSAPVLPPPSSSGLTTIENSCQLPKIPKSLTVIPQTVTRSVKASSSSPALSTTATMSSTATSHQQPRKIGGESCSS